MNFEKENGWCSWCYSYCGHLLVKKNKLGRDEYKCTDCYGNTLFCISGCGAFTAGSKFMFCSFCRGIITTWEQAAWDKTMLNNAQHNNGNNTNNRSNRNSNVLDKSSASLNSTVNDQENGNTVIDNRPPWQLDSAVDACTKCEIKFSLLTRRSHCRHCGMIFCRNCCKTSSLAIPNLGYFEPVPICSFCVPIIVSTNGGQPWRPDVNYHHGNGPALLLPKNPDNSTLRSPETDSDQMNHHQIIKIKKNSSFSTSSNNSYTNNHSYVRSNSYTNSNNSYANEHQYIIIENNIRSNKRMITRHNSNEHIDVISKFESENESETWDL